MITVYLGLDLTDPGQGQDQGHRVEEPAGVERDAEVSDHQEVVLVGLVVLEVGLHSKVVTEVHHAVAADDEDGGDGRVEEGGPIEHGDTPAEGDLGEVTESLSHHQHDERGHPIRQDDEGEDPDHVEGGVDLDERLSVL